jgi:hypothetical protein
VHKATDQIQKGVMLERENKNSNILAHYIQRKGTPNFTVCLWTVNHRATVKQDTTFVMIRHLAITKTVQRSSLTTVFNQFSSFSILCSEDFYYVMLRIPSCTYSHSFDVVPAFRVAQTTRRLTSPPYAVLRTQPISYLTRSGSNH